MYYRVVAHAVRLAAALVVHLSLSQAFQPPPVRTGREPLVRQQRKNNNNNIRILMMGPWDDYHDDEFYFEPNPWEYGDFLAMDAERYYNDDFDSYYNHDYFPSYGGSYYNGDYLKRDMSSVRQPRGVKGYGGGLMLSNRGDGRVGYTRSLRDFRGVGVRNYHRPAYGYGDGRYSSSSDYYGGYGLKRDMSYVSQPRGVKGIY